MKIFVRLFLLLFVIAGSAYLPNQDLKAQDPRFTQYYQSPMRLNPAMTGVFEGLWRVGANFRTQWGSVMRQPYNTYHFMADMRTDVFKHDYIGVGFAALTDISGGGVYNITDLGLSFSYQKKLTGMRRSYGKGMTSYLVAGAQLGIGQRAVKWNDLTFSQQYVVDDNSYDPNLSSGEGMSIVRRMRLYPDLSAGLMWFATFGKRKSAYAGLSIFHVNMPKIGLIDRSSGTNSYGMERLYMRIVGHVGGEYLLGKRGSLSIIPGFVGMFQGPAMELNFGAGIKYQKFKYDDFALKLSVWSRLSNMLQNGIHADAIMVIVGIDYQNFQFGVSYDVNVSTLMAATRGQGSLEFSIIYTHDGKHKREMGCPAFN